MNVGQQLGLGRRICDQNREITVVSIKIRDGSFVGLNEAAIAGQEITAMRCFQGGDVIFDQAAQADHVGGVSPNSFLLVVPDGDVEEGPGKQADNEDAGGSAAEKFKAKMFRAKKP